MMEWCISNIRMNSKYSETRHKARPSEHELCHCYFSLSLSSYHLFSAFHRSWAILWGLLPIEKNESPLKFVFFSSWKLSFINPIRIYLNVDIHNTDRANKYSLWTAIFAAVIQLWFACHSFKVMIRWSSCQNRSKKRLTDGKKNTIHTKSILIDNSNEYKQQNKAKSIGNRTNRITEIKKSLSENKKLNK